MISRIIIIIISEISLRNAVTEYQLRNAWWNSYRAALLSMRKGNCKYFRRLTILNNYLIQKFEKKDPT